MSKEVRTTASTGGQKGVKLERFDLIPAGPHLELAVHFGRGAMKYDEHQWRSGYEWSKSVSALNRHMNAFERGENYDVCENEPEACQEIRPDGSNACGYIEGIGSTCYNHTGSHHLTCVAWHSFVLLEFKDTHPDHDDRYIIRRSSK